MKKLTLALATILSAFAADAQVSKVQVNYVPVTSSMDVNLFGDNITCGMTNTSMTYTIAPSSPLFLPVAGTVWVAPTSPITQFTGITLIENPTTIPDPQTFNFCAYPPGSYVITYPVSGNSYNLRVQLSAPVPDTYIIDVEPMP